MSAEQSRVTRVNRYEGRDLSELRNALLAFPRVAKPENGNDLDAELVRGAAQRVVDAMRAEIHEKLGGRPSDEQARYFREALKTMAMVSADRLRLPAYESLLQQSAGLSDVALNENRRSVRPLDRDSSASGSWS